MAVKRQNGNARRSVSRPSRPAPPSRPQRQSQDVDYDNDGRGVLFVNDKQGVEARPDMTGHVKINPNEYEIGSDGLIEIRLAAWNRNADSVGDYLSLAASPRQAK